MADPEQVLRRFTRQIRSVSRKAADEFAPHVEQDDAEQEASVLILSCAGIMPGWHSGKLKRIEAQAKGDEKRIKRIVYSQLRQDLYQQLGRHMEKAETCTTPEELPPSQEPSYEPEDKWISRVDLPGYVRGEYPYLYMHAVEQMTLDEIAHTTGEGTTTVDRRIATEKHRAAKDPYFVQQKG